MARIKFNKMGNDLPLPAEEGVTQHMRFGMVKVNKAEAKDEDSGTSTMDMNYSLFEDIIYERWQ